MTNSKESLKNQTKLDQFKYEVAQEMGLKKNLNKKSNDTDNSKQNR